MRAEAKFVMIAPLPGAAILIGLGLPGLLRAGGWDAMAVFGLTLSVLGLVGVTVARAQLGDSFSIEPRAASLVTRGLYARIRAPIYVFSLVFLGGLLLYFREPWLLLLLAPIAAVQRGRAGREARVLEARFGDAYRGYRARTWF